MTSVDEPVHTSSQATVPAIHYLPCSIDFDGPSQISSYFKVEANSPNQWTSAFRGHELKGVTVHLPSNMHGYLLSRADPQERLVHVTEKFEDFVHWDHDTRPEENAFLDQLEWLEIAQSVSFVCDTYCYGYVYVLCL